MSRPSSDLWVPVVLAPVRDARVTSNAVGLRRVAAGQRPPAAYVREGDTSVVGLCEGVSLGRFEAHGELPGEAWVVPRHPGFDGKTLQGRSADLALALASVSAYEGLPLARLVIATGRLFGRTESGAPSAGSLASELLLTSADAVLPVDHLDAKLEACLRILARRGWSADDATVLYPGCQAPTAAGPCALPGELFERWRTLFGAALDTLLPVDTLTEAADRVLVKPSGLHFGRSPIGALRKQVYALRYVQLRASDLLVACRELHGMACRLEESAALRPIARLHALSSASFACSKLARDSASAPCRWDDDAPTAPVALKSHLDKQIEQLLQKTTPLPDGLSELYAAHRNYEATESFFTSDFEEGVELATEGLAVEGLRKTPECEYRKLLGTRGQFGWRVGLRALAEGYQAKAKRRLDRANRDLALARRAAESPDIAERNDRSRTRVYHGNLLLARWVAGLEDSGTPGRVAAILSEVLRSYSPHTYADARPPSQDPTWALQQLYTCWGLSGRWADIVEHWERVAKLPGATDAEGDERTLAAAVLDPAAHRLPPAEPIAALLFEAALRVGDRRTAEAASGAVAAPDERTPVSLARLVEWWPVVDAPPGWALDGIRAWVDDWRLGRRCVALPPAAQGVAFVQCRLDALRDERGLGPSGGARSGLLLWLGRPAWPTGRTP